MMEEAVGGAGGKTTSTSLKVFRSFFKTRPDGTLDASGLFSPECYQTWLVSRKNKDLPEPDRQFQRAISSHISSLDGRVPFTEEEEAAVLFEIRKKQVWPCFEGNERLIGVRGFTALGFHEKRKSASTSLAAAAAQENPLPAAKRKRRPGRLEEEEEEDQAAADAARRRTAPPPENAAAMPLTAHRESVPHFLPQGMYLSPDLPLPPATAAAAAQQQLTFFQFLPQPQWHLQQQQLLQQQQVRVRDDGPVLSTLRDYAIFDQLAGAVRPELLAHTLSSVAKLNHLPPLEKWIAMFEQSLEMHMAGGASAPAPPSRRRDFIELQQWVDVISRENPQEVIYVYDMLTREFRERYVCQNKKSLEVLGLIVNTAETVYCSDQLVLLSVAFGASFCNPGMQFPTPLYLKCKDGGCPERRFKVWFEIDHARGLALCCAMEMT